MIIAGLLQALSGNASSGTTDAATSDRDGDSDGSTAQSAATTATTATTATSATAASGASGSLSDLLSKLVSAIDGNVYGPLSADALKAAARKLQTASDARTLTAGATGAAQPHYGRHSADNDGDRPGDAGAAATASGTQTTSSAGDAVQSLCNALGNAVANEAPDATSVSNDTDVAEQSVAASKIAA